MVKSKIFALSQGVDIARVHPVHAKRQSLLDMAPDRAESGGKSVKAAANDRKQAGAGLGQRELPRPAAA
jgi:hypothetical protein